MTLAINDDGSEALIIGLSEVSEATRLEPGVVLQLYARGLFPDPVHHHPPLWSASAIRQWVRAAACDTSYKADINSKRRGARRA